LENSLNVTFVTIGANFFFFFFLLLLNSSNTVKHIILFIVNLIKNDQWTRSIFDMLYLPWSDQKVIKDREKPPTGIIGKMQK
jgi:hypothetical protein